MLQTRAACFFTSQCIKKKQKVNGIDILAAKKLFLLYYFGKYNTIQLEKQEIHI